MPTVSEDRLLDARGLYCPMPVVRAGRELKTLQPGQVLKVLVNDPAARTDFPAWVADTGNQLLESAEEPGGILVFYVRKGDEAD